MDFDGVLTDGGIYFSNNGDSFRRFDAKDGLAIKLLQKNFITTAIISGSKSKIINDRCGALGIKIIKKGIKNKLVAINEIQKENNFSSNQTLFLGDDINDLSVLPSVELFIVPADAHTACKANANLIADSSGGNGFIREITDKILLSKGIDPYCAFETCNEN